MSSSASEKGITIATSCVILAIVGVAQHKLERNRGRQWIPHAIFWGAVALPLILLLPTTISKYIFSAVAVTVVGTVLPIYESVRAICTPEEDDDKAWLQYWMVGGIIFMATGWVDDVIKSDTVNYYWHESIFFLFVWLYFPKTDGAALIYDCITEPYISPKIKPLAAKMTNFITELYQLMVNAVHLWLLWIIFLFLPAGLKRLIAVLIGTVYPLVSSIAAASTEQIEDDTYWLTYWSVYGCLFLIMQVLETWLGRIPGFYTLIIMATVYLMLPMFGGADKVFRKVLVPLAGLKELLMLSDAIRVKKTMLKDLDPERAKIVRKAIAKFYDDDDDTADPAELKKEVRQVRNVRSDPDRKRVERAVVDTEHIAKGDFCDRTFTTLLMTHFPLCLQSVINVMARHQNACDPPPVCQYGRNATDRDDTYCVKRSLVVVSVELGTICAKFCMVNLYIAVDVLYFTRKRKSFVRVSQSYDSMRCHIHLLSRVTPS
jgi:hypothetical protein